MIKCPKCKKMAIKSALVGEDRLMRTWCKSCGFVVEQEGYGVNNANNHTFKGGEAIRVDLCDKSKSSSLVSVAGKPIRSFYTNCGLVCGKCGLVDISRCGEATLPVCGVCGGVEWSGVRLGVVDVLKPKMFRVEVCRGCGGLVSHKLVDSVRDWSYSGAGRLPDDVLKDKIFRGSIHVFYVDSCLGCKKR